MSAPRPRLLITGATGKQGGAVIDALLSASAPFDILALTRDASSARARALASKPKVTVVEGDLASIADALSKHGPIYGVFLVTVAGDAEAEERLAKSVVAEAIKAGVEHFIFSSVDRGGADRTDDNPTNVPHFASKHRAEVFLKEKSAGTQMQWTILRPVGFMENLTPDFKGRAFISIWAGMGDKPLQIVSVRDIGLFAAAAFANLEAYKGRAISLGGDALTVSQAAEVFKATCGYNLPKTFWFVGPLVKFIHKDLGSMFEFLRVEGPGTNFPKYEPGDPKLQNFATWLTETSGFKRK